MQPLSPVPTFSTPQSICNDVGNGNGSEVAGNKEGDGKSGKSDGNGDEGGGRVKATMAMATVTTRAMATVTRWRATTRAMARAARAMATAMRMASDEEGNGKDSKRNGDGNLGGGQQRG